MSRLTALKPRAALLQPLHKTARTARIRGRELQRIRAALLRADPLCVKCAEAGRVSEATEVDHIVALVNGGHDTDANRQGLCAECHAEKTAGDMLEARGGSRAE